MTAVASAQDPTAMAPPVQTDTPQAPGGSVGADSVFHWQEVPQNQQVPLTSAAFDQGGYQLYDIAGETIIVPFTNQNLYMMKFARSSTSTMYFVNEGSYPVLYVPRHGYLGNATVVGARWYPFGKGFHPTEPVYLGIAPSWSEFTGMGWYPDMYCYGGYWSQTSFVQGGVFGPSLGLFFVIGGQHYYGWNGYHRYSQGHSDFSRTGYYRRSFYRSSGRPHGSLRPLGGGNYTDSAHRAFVGAANRAGGQQSFGEHYRAGSQQGFGDGRSFQGTSGSRQNGHVSGRYQGGGHQGGGGFHQGSVGHQGGGRSAGGGSHGGGGGGGHR